MKTSTFALSALSLASLAAAAPLRAKREDIVWVTQVEVVTDVVEITTTIWVDSLPTPAVPVPSNGAEFFEKPKEEPKPVVATTTLVTSTSTSSSTSSTPTPVAPTPTSTPAAVVPPVVPSPVVPSPVVAAPIHAKSSIVEPAPSSTPAPVAPQPQPSTPTTGQVYSGGDITYYDPAGGYGSCGTTIQNSDDVVALPFGMMDKISAKSNGHPWCGKKVAVYFGGQTYYATVEDKCMGCKDNDIDMTSGFFKKVTGGSVDGRGKGQAKWAFVE